MSLRCAVAFRYGNHSLGLVYLLKRFIMVKKRFIIFIDPIDWQNATFTCGIICHRYSRFNLHELINVFS